jgi:hypothetical protein
VCSSCHHPSAVLEKWRQCFPFNGWWVMNAFIWHSAETTEHWMACLKVTEEENCTAPQSGCSDSPAYHVLQLKWAYACTSHATWYDSQWPILLRTLAGYTEAASSP